ncbi:MAG: beta-ketoacyl synthase N-terminal-like domain-containing protein [Candidatus Sedimenticola sp. (ex Thyasira tokunagai)]
MTHSTKYEALAITGLGVFSAIGLGSDEFMRSLRDGYNGIGANTMDHLPMHAAALLPEFDFKDLVKRLALPKIIHKRTLVAANRLPKTAQASVICALQAWHEAGLFEDKTLDRSRIGIILAGQNTSTGYSYETLIGREGNLRYVAPSYGINFLDTNLIGVISEILDIHGLSFSVGGASATGNVATIQSCNIIRQNMADICLVLAPPADISPLEAQAWLNMGAMRGGDLPAEECCRPFDAKHGGFVYGQGAGVIVLESVSSANRRGCHALAHCLGEGFYLDGNRMANPSHEGQVNAMRKALENSGIDAVDVQYVNTHGSSSPLGDKTEADSIKEVFYEANKEVWLNSTKSLIGHCLYAAGLVELIATVLQIKGGFIHPNLNLINPIDTKLSFAGEKAIKMPVNYALNNSYGFGGINSSLVITK